jgi:hypothetical protein
MSRATYISARFFAEIVQNVADIVLTSLFYNSCLETARNILTSVAGNVHDFTLHFIFCLSIKSQGTETNLQHVLQVEAECLN